MKQDATLSLLRQPAPSKPKVFIKPTPFTHSSAYLELQKMKTDIN
jgi:hypothetical protein